MNPHVREIIRITLLVIGAIIIYADKWNYLFYLLAVGLTLQIIDAIYFAGEEDHKAKEKSDNARIIYAWILFGIFMLVVYLFGGFE